MEDRQIVDLYFERSESAISETDKKYGRYCHYIAYRILENDEDAKEIVNDTYLKAWNTIPPNRPDPLKPYVGMLSRQFSLDRYEEYHTQKRGGQVMLVLDELGECIPDTWDVTADFENGRLRSVLNNFIGSLSEQKRNMFVLRYFCSKSVSDIAYQMGFTEGKVKTILHRTRLELKNLLEEEGLPI